MTANYEKPAPPPVHNPATHPSGMSKLEYVATQVLSGMLARTGASRLSQDVESDSRIAIMYAPSLLKNLEHEEGR